ncbi:hypothetical protein N7470_004460 [Penicillium chermesinum]|nr:hypothetical protein N7470_004460 [Penicillium chermesinum]
MAFLLDVATNWVISPSALILLICYLPILFLCRQRHAHRPKGCRRIGVPAGQSELLDEYDPKYSEGVPASQNHDGKPAWRIKALFTYPLKSCAGIELKTSRVVPTGLEFDRQFVFAENGPEGWDCRTLRNAGYQKLALIVPEIWVPDPSAPDYDPARVMGILTSIGVFAGVLDPMHSFQVPLHPAGLTSYPLVPVRIWKDKPLSYDYTSLIPGSLHRYLGFTPSASRLALLRASSEHSREIFRNAPRKEAIGFQPTTAFADAYPIHLLNLASHRDVAARCAYAIPKLSVVRPEAFAEDHWTKIQIAGVEIYAACRTVRCKLPNVDPRTGIRHPAEPDKTLKAYRRIDDGDRTNACLGMQLVPAAENFKITVGDEIKVLAVGAHRYIKMLAPGEKVEGV